MVFAIRRHFAEATASRVGWRPEAASIHLATEGVRDKFDSCIKKREKDRRGAGPDRGRGVHKLMDK